MPTPAQQFIAQAAALAQRLGVKMVVISCRDPQTNAPLVVASPGAMDDLYETLSEKLKPHAPQVGYTSWE